MSPAAEAATLVAELAAIAGEQHVVEDADALRALAIDDVAPRVAVSPGSAEEIAAILKLAWARDLVVVPAGGFTGQGSGGVPERVDILLRTTRLNAVEHYDPGDLTIGLGAGITLAEAQRRLAEHGQLLPLEAARPEVATVGGALVTAAQGPLKHGYGGVRDFCIGVKFVTGDGLVAKGGGRVVKNVAGYDLMKLMIGSFGTLGVVVSANFKVFPRPGQTRTFVCKFVFANGAIQYRDRLLRSPLTPMCMEYVSPRAHEYLAGRGGENALLVRAAGSDAVVARYRAELGNYVKEELEGEAEASLWRAVPAFEESVLRRHRNAMIVQVSVPLDWVAQAINTADEVATNYNFLCALVGRVGAGSLTVAFIPIAVDPPSAMQYANAVSAYRAALPPDASVVVRRCPREAKPHFSLWGSTPTDLASMRAVKKALDPANILNRGRFLV